MNSSRKSKIKKCVSCLVVMVVLVSFLTLGASAQKTVVRWRNGGWSEWIPTFEKWANDFMAKNPEIEIISEGVPSGYLEKLRIELAAGTQPDVMWINANMFNLLAGKRVFLDLEPYLAKDAEMDKEAYYPALVEMFSLGGKLLGMPQGALTMGVIYNEELFDKAGLPYPNEQWTWNTVEEVAKKLTEDINGDGKTDQWGFGGVSTSTWEAGDIWGFIWQEGGQIFNADRTKSLLDSPEAVRGLEMFWGMVDAPFAPSQEDNQAKPSYTRFFENQIAAQVWAQNNNPYMDNNFPDLRYEFTLIPKSPNTGERSHALYGTCWTVAERTNSPDAAYEFAKYLTSIDIMRDSAQLGAELPALKEAATSLVVPGKRPNNVWVFPEMMKYQRPVPALREDPDKWDRILKVLRDGIEKLTLKKQTVEDYAKSATSEINKILAEEAW